MTLSPVRWGFSFLAKPLARACTRNSTTLIDVRLAPTSGAEADTATSGHTPRRKGTGFKPVPPYELRRHGVEALLSIVLHRRDRLIVTVGVPGIDTCLIEVRGTEVPRGEEREKWIVDYLDQDGKRHVETFDRKKAAVDREAKVRIDIGKGIHVASSNSITVAEAADRWLRNVEANGRERSTLRQYQQHVKHHIVPRIGRIKLAKLTATTVENFRNQLLGNGNGGEGALSRPLARKVLTSLKSLLKTAKYSHVAADVKIDSSKRQQRLEPGATSRHLTRSSGWSRPPRHPGNGRCC
jgi:integrase-like protein